MPATPVLEVKSFLVIYKKFKVNMGYLRAYLKTQAKKKVNKKHKWQYMYHVYEQRLTHP